MPVKIHDRPSHLGDAAGRGNTRQRRARRLRLAARDGHEIVPGIYVTACAHGCLTPVAAEDLPGVERMEVDKILTHSEGGRYTDGNSQPSCKRCNRCRGPKPMPWVSPYRPTRAQLTLAI